ncbi:iron sulfur cluster assembly protein 1 [Nannizzia gypsea CBS 118893]|uniref:Iron-sulfur cluster assembly protein n=1 Tax=Arthroderma gypseum (strain ATCC MYA-4604 / CBS 118893) TaxID=535722 RepID=E5QYP0_ARTGP|nr:iron sulfur cluster assembly protein 1 [Nannizzia gypsea CBS 118893]EFQ98903.1 iron sulfur cluster assembly protein 1 [Nannizzia gypsea CBS 118893]
MFRRAVSLAPRATRCIASPAISRPALTPLSPVPALTLRSTRGYHEKDMSPLRYCNPRNVGSMSKTDMDVGTGLVGAPACGDVMKLQIRVDKSNNTISDVKFKTFGCGSAIASSSYLTELVRGMTLEEAAKIRNTEIAKELCLPPVKLHCSMLAEDAIKSAINNYYSKNPTATDLSGTGASIAEVAAQPAAQPATATPPAAN